MSQITIMAADRVVPWGNGKIPVTREKFFIKFVVLIGSQTSSGIIPYQKKLWTINKQLCGISIRHLPSTTLTRCLCVSLCICHSISVCLSQTPSLSLSHTHTHTHTHTFITCHTWQCTVTSWHKCHKAHPPKGCRDVCDNIVNWEKRN